MCMPIDFQFQQGLFCILTNCQTAGYNGARTVPILKEKKIRPKFLIFDSSSSFWRSQWPWKWLNQNFINFLSIWIMVFGLGQ